MLDPFCGSGTTLVAAQALGRHWWGVDSWSGAKEIVVERLAANFGLQPNRDYAVLNDDDIAEFPIVSAAYTDAITRVAEITQLQEGVSALASENARLEENVSELTGHLLSLKMAMNIGENDDAGTEQVIQQMQNWIAKKITTPPNSVDYIKVVCAWLTGWESLGCSICQVYRNSLSCSFCV